MYLVADKALAQRAMSASRALRLGRIFPIPICRIMGLRAATMRGAWFRAMDFAQLNGSPADERSTLDPEEI
jgi:hypothetical protein